MSKLAMRERPRRNRKSEAIRAFAEFDSETIMTLQSEWRRLDFAYCYCSVLDTCWSVDSRDSEAGRPEHREVDACAIDPATEVHH